MKLDEYLEPASRMGCYSIINENDAVNIEELRFGDNDTLAIYG